MPFPPAIGSGTTLRMPGPFQQPAPSPRLSLPVRPTPPAVPRNATVLPPPSPALSLSLPWTDLGRRHVPGCRQLQQPVRGAPQRRLGNGRGAVKAAGGAGADGCGGGRGLGFGGKPALCGAAGLTPHTGAQLAGFGATAPAFACRPSPAWHANAHTYTHAHTPLPAAPSTYSAAANVLLQTCCCVQVVGEYHAGYFVNRFRHGSLVMRLPDSEAALGAGTAGLPPPLLMCATDGRLAVLARLPWPLFELMEKLQAGLALALVPQTRAMVLCVCLLRAAPAAVLTHHMRCMCCRPHTRGWRCC